MGLLGAAGAWVHGQEFFDPGLPLSVQGGPSSFSGSRGNPYDEFSRLQAVPYLPSSSSGNNRDYNFKWGNFTATMGAGLQIGFSDNVLYAESSNADSDIYLMPQLRLSSRVLLSQYNDLSLDLGIGYQYYLNHGELSTVTAAVLPNSVVAYRVLVGDVMVVLYDRLTAPSDYRLRPEVVGGTEAAVNYQRLQNTTGLTASWIPVEDMSMSAGYGYTVDRSLSGDFSLMNRNIHGFNTSAEQRLSPRWSAGVYGSYNMVTSVTSQQNDSTGWSIGPLISYRPTRYIAISAAVGYSVTTFENNALLAGFTDSANFAGATYEVSVQHLATRYFNHGVTASKGTQFGYGNNFSEVTSVTYRASANVFRSLSLSAGFMYMVSDMSQRSAITGVGGAEDIRLTLGTSYPLGRKADIGAYYSRLMSERTLLLPTTQAGTFAERAVKIPENSVVMTLNYRF